MNGKVATWSFQQNPGMKFLDKLETKFIFDNKILSRSMSKV